MYESKLICRSTLEVGRSVLEQCGARLEQLEGQASELDGEAARTVEVINAREDKLVEGIRKSSEALLQTVWSHKEVLRQKLMSKELSTRHLYVDLPNLTQEQQLQEWEKLDREEVKSSFLLTPADTFGGIGKLLMVPKDMAKEYTKEAQDMKRKELVEVKEVQADVDVTREYSSKQEITDSGLNSDAGQKEETNKRWCHICKKKVNGSTMQRHMAG